MLATPKAKRASEREAAIVDAMSKSPRFLRSQVRRWMAIEKRAARVHQEWQRHLDENGQLRGEAAQSVWSLCALFDHDALR